MKKSIFIVLTGTLLILILIYFYDKTEVIINKKYNSNNIYIEYPYFNNQEIDNYINNYLNTKILDTKNIFIDYDYYKKNNIVNLTIYTYKELNNKINFTQTELIIDINDSKVYSSNNTNIVDTNKPYIAEKIDPNKPMIALTFDDGPNQNTIKILDILDKYNVKASFFILGTNIENNKDIIKRMYKSDMEIGNHTYSHRLLTKQNKVNIHEEINKTDTLIFNITNEYPTLLRPSYGSVNKYIKSISNRPIIAWNIDTQDWKYHNSKRIANKILKSTDGDIILLHDIYNASANAIDIAIPKLLEKGYQLVTVSELFYYKNINLEPGKIYFNIK